MALSRCPELLFTEAGDIGERVRAAPLAGYPAGEMWSWRSKDLDGFERALRETGLHRHGRARDWQ